MKKSIIQVPQGVRYISQWSNFSFRGMFPGPCIIDKVIPGCGMTSQAILGPEPTILCSPRRMLLQNKHEQHQDPKNGFTYLVINDSEVIPDIEKILGKPVKTPNPPGKGINVKELSNDLITNGHTLLREEEDRQLRLSQDRIKVTDRIRKELWEYFIQCRVHSVPPKILVTYDSFGIIRSILEDRSVMQDFTVFVDEFQAILSDARFKSDTELSFLTNLRGLDKVYFVSATPMMDNYIDQIPEFNNLTLYKLDWETLQPGRLSKPDLKVKSTARISRVIDRIIESYRTRKFDCAHRNGVLVYSEEAVFYVNSVDVILNTIKRNGLTPGEVNILCSDTPYNRSRVVKTLGNFYSIGRVPLRNEPRKMFTFCTRTVYLGADFYSDNARSFIFSDSNRDYLSVDISLDLPQILGRQRLLENPWKNSAEFYYLPTLVEGTGKEELDKLQNIKKENTDRMLNMYFSSSDETTRNLLAARLQNYAVSKNYVEDYVSVNIKADNTGKLSLIPAYNYLVKLSEQRAFDIQQVDYKDRFSVASSITGAFGDSNVTESDLNYLEFLRQIDTVQYFHERARLFCESSLTESQKGHYISTLPPTDILRMAVESIGSDRMASYSYDLSKIKGLIKRASFDIGSIRDEVIKRFSPGQVFLRSDLKELLQSVYDTVGYSAKAKASDINNYFNTKDVQLQTTDQNGNRKRSSAISLVSLK